MGPSVSEELRLFDKLIRVLEDALEEAAKILGPNATPPSTSHYRPLEHANQVFTHLSDLLDAARAGRSQFLERQ
jgi:hypothetical protein